MKHLESKRLFDQAQSLLPGGVNSPARAFGGVGGSPLVIDRADGPYLFDVDGNRYLDYVLSWGPMILGHQYPAVTKALEVAIHRGTSFGAPTRQENEMAELLVQMVPSIEKVRLVNSGTEATMSAIRLARGYTGRNKIVKFIGNYHGHVDSLLVAAGSAAATLAVPNSPGVTKGTTTDTLLLPYNDPEAVYNLFQEYGNDIAVVIVEPVAGNMGCVVGSLPFLTTLRTVTKANGALLLFDEVLCGFRVAAGGAQERFGITPDLTTLGKVIGGGLPVGAYGGRAEIMDSLLPVGQVFQAGTLSGNPLAMAAGIATLRTIQEQGPSFYNELECKMQRLANALLEKGKKAGFNLSAPVCGSLMTLFFLAEGQTAVHSWQDAALCRTDLFAKFFWGMIERGIYLPCSQFEALFLSAAHDDIMIDATIDAADSVFQSFCES